MSPRAPASGRGEVRIGISGWTYRPWRGGPFYPRKLKQSAELAYAARMFSTIEINGTFYGLLKPDDYAKVHDETPEGFVFSVKGSRFITHLLKARDAGTAVSNFLASGVLRLGRKWGVTLWQFPPRHRFERETLERFLQNLPRDTDQAARMARRHDARVTKGVWTRKIADIRLRHAVEIRNESFVVPEFIDLLREQDVGLVVADTVKWPLLFDTPSDFVYCRLHGSQELYVSGYDDAALDEWARRIRAWSSGRQPRGGRRAGPRGSSMPRDVFVYFDNDAKVRAPGDALRLMQRLGQAPYKMDTAV